MTSPVDVGWLATLACAAAVAFSPRPSHAQSAPEQEPDAAAMRIGLGVGGAWASNVYGNASQTGDLVGLARLDLDADWTLSPSALLKLTYRGDIQGYKDLHSEHNTGHLLDAALGLRPIPQLYLSLRGGGEAAYYPELLPTVHRDELQRDESYTFWGGFGGARARLELGETQTLEMSYTFRSDQSAYDLDNRTSSAQLAWGMAVGDTLEVSLPAALELTTYTERFVLDANQQPTGESRTATRIIAEPTLKILPSLDLELTVALRGEHNASNDTYYYEGPFGLPDPAVTPELIRHYESYTAVSGRLRLRWTVSDVLSADAALVAGRRVFPTRPAHDAGDLPIGAAQVDVWIEPAVQLRWRLAELLAVEASYALHEQWSNDYLWDFDAHRLTILLTTWWEG